MRRLAKKLTAFILCALMVLPFAANIGFAADAPRVNVNETVEAESGLLAGGAVLNTDSNASGGTSVKFTALNGEPSNWGNPPSSDTEGELSFNIYSETGGVYELWIRYYALDGGSDSFFYSMGSGAYTAPYIAANTDYTWVKLTTVTLSAGDNLLRFHRREAGFMIDSIKITNEIDYDSLGAKYAEPVYTSGNVEYPRLLDADSIGNVAAFEAGDRVAFIGDSITHGGYHHSLIFNYYSTRYPEASFSYVNKGIGGDVVTEIMSRMDHDVFDAEDVPFNKAVVMIGTNDMSRSTYFEGAELDPNAEISRANRINSYRSNLTNLIQTLKARGLEQIVLMSSPLFDQWLPDELTNKPSSVDFNNVIRKAGSIAYEVSVSEGVDFVDVNTPQTIVQYYNMEKQGESFTFVPDRVHPNAVGHYIMAYAFLKAQGESGEVASVDVDVTGQRINASNASVSEFAASAGAVTYKYKPNSLPLGADSTYRTAETLFPISDELNREIIKVSGLSDGVYDIKMDGSVVMQATAAQLKSGINIADKKNNPGQQQALKVLGITNQRRSLESEYRDFIGKEIDYIAKYKLDSTSSATLISSAQTWIANNPSSTSDIGVLNDYISAKNSESEMIKNIAKFEQAVYDRNKPTEHLVVIEPSTAEQALQPKTVYFDYELPQYTLMIKPRSAAVGVSLDRIVFSDANGELSAVPATGTSVNAAATLKNNTDKAAPAILWVGTYKGDRLMSVSTKSVTLQPGESVPVNTSLLVCSGADKIKAGVWNNLESANPYAAAAVFPSEQSGLKAVYVNGIKFDEFNEAQTQYVYYVNKLNANVPYVNVASKNTNSDITVTQAGALGESATINTPSATYTIRFENEPIPVLSSLKVDGVDVEGFSPTKYTYSLDLEGEGLSTISATAAEGLNVAITQPTETDKTATIVVTSPFGYKRTYTITVSKLKLGTPGEVTNMKWQGADAGSNMMAVPSLGATSVNYYDASKTPEQMLAAVAADNVYIDGNSYEFYSNESRLLANMWTTPLNKYYGYNTQFMYADNGASMFIDPLITRVVKPDCDNNEGYADPSKVYEFDISKGATVYITTQLESPYISTLSDWTYEYNVAKYAIGAPSYKDIASTDDPNIKYRIPSGSTVPAEVAKGYVYYKHFNAGHVEIPTYNNGTDGSYRKSAIFIVWDECNRESEIYDILVDGNSIGAFDKDTLEYTVSVAQGEAVPTVSVSATAGAEASVVQASTIGESATVTACGKTYTIRFATVDVTPGTLSNIKWKGTLDTKMAGVPSVGIDLPNLMDTTLYPTADDQVAATRALAGTQYDTNAYTGFNEEGDNRTIAGTWASGAANLKFIYAHTANLNSVLYGEKVTRLYKPSADLRGATTATDTSKIYEFDIDKDATVYITTSESKAQNGAETTSNYIAGFGWNYEYDTTKYRLYTYKPNSVFSPTYGTSQVPNGQTKIAWTTSGSAYYKHFKAGETVEIPAFSETASDLQISVFVVWDNCNNEAKIFDIMADGVSIADFDENKTEYTVLISEDATAVPTVSVSATAGAGASVVQAGSIGESATVTACGKTYTIRFATVDTTPGTVSNFKKGGASSTLVYAAPSVGIDPPNLTVDTNGNSLSDEEQFAALKNMATTYPQYNTQDYVAFSDKTIVNCWNNLIGSPSVYGYNMKFIYGTAPNSIFMGEQVTRVVKPCNDSPTAATAEKMYEFDIDKDATVYISVSNKYGQSKTEVHSTYIEGLNKGWTYDYDSEKYVLYTWNFVEKKDSSNTLYAYIPNGGKKVAWASSGSVYYKHFKAGETVEIPAFSETESNYQTTIFVVWDNCNDEAKIFDIMADGVSIADFDENTLAYTLNVEAGSSVPQIAVSATYGANARVTQAESLDAAATVTACGKTYTIRFNQVEPNMTLSTLSVNGTLIDGFDPEVKEYTYTVERGNMVMPTIEAVPTISTRTAEVKYPVKMPGAAKVTVTSASGASEVYTVNIVKTGTPGVVSNIYAGGVATTGVTAMPALGIDIVDMYNMYETDAERITAVMTKDSSVNPYYYTDARYSQYTDRWPGTAWNIKTSSTASPANTYGGNIEFTYVNYANSVLISPDVTRLYKSTTDPTGTEEKAKKSYEFDISKDATVYITTNAVSDFIASQPGWTYDHDAKYQLYYPKTTVVRDENEIGYSVPNGGVNGMGNAGGHVYYKHFTKDERVVVPAFAADASYRKMNVFIVWDDCNDERHLYSVNYAIAGGENTAVEFDAAKTVYDITVPQGTTAVPTLDVSATRPANIRVDAPAGYTNGKAVVKMTAELEEGTTTTYTFNFYVDSAAEDDIRVKSVTFDGIAYNDFEMYTRDYAIDLAYGIEYPVLAAEANSDVASMVITQPADNGGVGIVSMTSQSGAYSALYTFTFTKLDYIPAEAEIMNVKDGRKSIVTIVHDDGDLNTTLPYLSKEMDKNNLKTTVALIGSRVINSNGTINTKAAAQWQAYLDTGRFNIANHSWHHVYWGQNDTAESGTLSDGKAYNIGDGFMTQEIITSGEKLREAFPNERVLAFVKPGFTYPTGLPQVSSHAYDMIRENYICMRNTGGVMNTIPPQDWDNVKSLMVQSNESYTSSNNHTAAYWTEEVDKTIASGGWLVFLFHNIVSDDAATGLGVSQSRTSLFLDALGDRVESGDVWNAFLDEAAMYIKESQTATVVAKDYTTEKNYISIAVTDEMDDSIYNYPITIKIAVPDTWAYVKNVQAGATEIKATFVENGTTYAYVNVVPDSESAIVSEADGSYYVSSITVGGEALDGFDAAKYDYEVMLPAGTTEAPIVAASSGTVEQATLTDGYGSAKVSIDVGSETFTYTIRFNVDKTNTGPVVLLKMDDLRENSTARNAMKNVAEYVNSKGGHVNAGVIGISLEDDGTKDEYYEDIKGLIADGNEVWSHGYYHDGGTHTEFSGGTYDEQLWQINQTNQLMLDKCGYTVTTFGAPYNQTDDTTKLVLADVPQIKATYFGPGGVEGVTDFTNSMSFEQSGTVDGSWQTWLNYKNMVAQYEANKDSDYLVMQIHPKFWASDKTSIHFKIFKDQVDYLLSQGARFMTASEYLESLSQ